MNVRLAEVRAFLAGMAGNGPAPTRVPQTLRLLAHEAARGRHDPDDLLQDALTDLWARTTKGQSGGLAKLLRLEDGPLLGALRRRVAQVRATQQGSRSRLVKSLRAHVKVTLEDDLPTIHTLPPSLMVTDRVSGPLVRRAVAFLLARADAPPREPRVLAAQLLGLFFAARPEDVRAEIHRQGDAGNRDSPLTCADAAYHVRELRRRLGPDLSRIIGLRAQGKALAEIAAGRAGVSTTHEKLGKAAGRIREYIQ